MKHLPLKFPLHSRTVNPRWQWCHARQQFTSICLCAAHWQLSWRMGVTRSKLAPIFRNMAWRSHGDSNTDLLDQLKSKERCNLFYMVCCLTKFLVLILVHEVLKSKRVEEALRCVDRKHYCRTRAFEDSPQPIGLCDVFITFVDAINGFMYDYQNVCYDTNACLRKLRSTYSV